MSKFDIADMMKAGLHFGHQKFKYHPGMGPYIFTTRNNVHIINLEKTGESLREALAYLQSCVRKGKNVLFVGTKPPIRALVEEAAEACGMPSVTNRWLGGTFTNFSVILKRIEYLKDLEQKRTAGELEKYTKKEKLLFDEDILSMNEKFRGIKNMLRLPDVMFVVDIDHDATAVREARRVGIPIVAIVDTNVDPKVVDYPIPANDDAISSVRFVLGAVREAVKEAKDAIPLEIAKKGSEDHESGSRTERVSSVEPEKTEKGEER